MPFFCADGYKLHREYILHAGQTFQSGANGENYANFELQKIF